MKSIFSKIIKTRYAQRKAVPIGLILTGAVLACQAIQATDAPTNTNQMEITAFYQFDEGSGYIAHDDSGHNYHGVACQWQGQETRSGTWTNGHSGKALVFDAAQEQFLRLPTEILSNEPQTGAIEFWIYPAPATQKSAIFSKATTGWGDFIIWYLPGGGIELQLQGYRIDSSCKTLLGNVPPNQWTHVRVVWDINDANRIYINSKERAAANPIQWTGGRLPTTVGCLMQPSRQPAYFFSGAIDDLKIETIPTSVTPLPPATGEAPNESVDQQE